MRKILLPAIIITATVLLLIRLFYLQIVNDSFKLKSENNAIKIKYDYPERGYIYDRYGKYIKQISPSTEGWDGTLNGQPLPSTDYWFTAEYQENGKSKEFKSHFSLVR